MMNRYKQHRDKLSYWDNLHLGFLCTSYRRSDQRGVGVFYKWRTFRRGWDGFSRPTYKADRFPKCKDFCYVAYPRFGEIE